MHLLFLLILMVNKTPDITCTKSTEAKELKEFNAETISTMTYKEIIQRNRDSHKGTFMDRTWRDGKEGTLAILNDQTLSRWQKFIQGGYSYQTITANMINKFEKNQIKVKFVEDLIQRKNEF